MVKLTSWAILTLRHNNYLKSARKPLFLFGPSLHTSCLLTIFCRSVINAVFLGMFSRFRSHYKNKYLLVTTILRVNAIHSATPSSVEKKKNWGRDQNHTPQSSPSLANQESQSEPPVPSHHKKSLPLLSNFPSIMSSNNNQEGFVNACDACPEEAELFEPLPITWSVVPSEDEVQASLSPPPPNKSSKTKANDPDKPRRPLSGKAFVWTSIES